jgi:hypothetical protein
VEIHKPKPWHGFREFLKEYLIIVVGVLTALGGEQAVETVHRHNEIREARSALDAELGFDLSALDLVVQQKDCALRRLDEIGRWAEAMEAGRPLALSGPIGRPSNSVFRTSVWRTATGGGVAQMPFDQRLKYGQLYDSVENNDGNRRRAIEAWDQMAKYVPAKRLDAGQLLEVRHQLDQVKIFYGVIEDSAVLMHREAERLTIKPVALSPSKNREQHIAELCRPVLAKDGAANGAPPQRP